MSTVKIDFSKINGKIKAMHAVNNGPVVAGKDQTRGNQEYYRAAKIPYARTHDAAFFSGYGGEHTVDVHAIFPNFDADVNDPASYDFPFTDLYMKQIIDHGTEPFFRLGSKIEHGIKKYGTIMPKDFKKWAQICEHIIAHYTEGWADGFHYNMEYWEIWNEPDLDPDDSTNKRCWSGTEAQFAEMFKISAKHLKARFPHLKIGGPASAGDEAWMKRFFERLKGTDTPLDFFSWHWYWTQPSDVAIKADRIRALLDEYGYFKTESILNEWNYVRSWTDEFVYSIKQIIGMKGSAFTSACMSACQNKPVDMLMYYDARPTAFNGLFDMYTYAPLKGYYPFYMWSKLYALENQAEATTDDECVYAIGAKNGDKLGAMVTYYSENDNDGIKKVSICVDGASLDGVKVYITDEDFTMQECLTYTVEGNTISLRLKCNSILYIEK
jgi:hypothetical protein